MFKNELELLKELNCDELRFLEPKRVPEYIIQDIIDDKNCYEE